jgi:TolA-binding protein
MLYMVINIALIMALAATSIFCVVMYRELRKFKAISGEYATILRETSRAVDNVERAVASVHEDGASTLIALGERIDAAQRTIDSLKCAEATAAALVMRLQLERRQASQPRAGREAETFPKAALPKAALPKAAFTKPAFPDASSPNAALPAAAMPGAMQEATSPGHGTAAMPTVTPFVARSVRTRETFEWPVVKSAGLTAHEA